jgi:tetratricopeptide (TPR) repeat protein
MDNDTLLRRVHELEIEVQKLKASVARSPQRQVQVVVKKSVGFVLTYWTLLSFLVAILIAIYIKYAFNVDYFENYRTLAGSRATSEFHTKLGNDLLRRQEWSAAEDAFTRALAANANNGDAGYGLLKSRIFKPPPGEKFTSPRTQDTMLTFLREQRPDDPDLDLLQAVRHWEQDQKEETKISLEAALAKKPDFSAALAIMGHVSMVEGDIPAAKAWTEKAVASDPQNANALSNLGFMALISGDFDDAIAKLERANFAEPNLLTPLVLSDACRLKGDFTGALGYSRSTARAVENADLRNSRYAGGEWFYNYLPLQKGDTASCKNGIYVTSLERKEGLCHFAHALDLALTGDPAAAEKPFTRALELMPADAEHQFFANKLRATIGWAPQSVPENTVLWLGEKLAALE